jgi:flagellar biosynthetic protein FliO
VRGTAAILLLLFAFPAWAVRVVVDWEYRYVNVRSGPSMDKEVVGRLVEGTEADVIERLEQWAKIRYPGGEGWVVERSLRLPPVEPTVSEPAVESAILASVPGVPAPEPSAAVTASPSPRALEVSGVETKVVPRVEMRTEPDAETPPDAYLAEYAEESTLSATDPGGGVLRLVSGLLLVFALLAAAVYLFRRFMGPRLLASRRAGGIQVLATRPLGSRHGLLLVEVGGLIWLVGQGAEGLRLIAEIRDPGALRRLNDRYGFLEGPFEAELRDHLDESRAGPQGLGGNGGRETSAPSPEERLAILRRRPQRHESPRY